MRTKLIRTKLIGWTTTGLRRCLAGAALVALAALGVAVFSAPVAGQDRQTHQHHPGMHPHMPAATTAEQQAQAAKLFDDVKAGIARLGNPAVAHAEGYRQTTPFQFGSWGPAHFNNRTYTRDGRLLDAERPEAIVYWKLSDGRMAMLGAMFLAPKGQGPRPGGPLTEWHVHDNLCIAGNGMAVLSTAPGQCPGGATFLGDAVEMLHVWTFDHPDGPFAHGLTPAAMRVAVRQFGR